MAVWYGNMCVQVALHLFRFTDMAFVGVFEDIMTLKLLSSEKWVRSFRQEQLMEADNPSRIYT